MTALRGPWLALGGGAALPLLLVACAPAGDAPALVKQMITTLVEESTSLEEADTWATVPRAAAIIRTTESSTIHALFVASAVGVPTPISVPGGEIPIGTPIEVKIEIDEQEMLPESAMFTGDGIRMASHAFLAIREDVEPGVHSVVVKWRSAEAGAILGNRTLTVWETGAAPSSFAVPNKAGGESRS